MEQSLICSSSLTALFLVHLHDWSPVVHLRLTCDFGLDVAHLQLSLRGRDHCSGRVDGLLECTRTLARAIRQYRPYSTGFAAPAYNSTTLVNKAESPKMRFRFVVKDRGVKLQYFRLESLY